MKTVLNQRKPPSGVHFDRFSQYGRLAPKGSTDYAFVIPNQINQHYLAKELSSRTQELSSLANS